MGDCVEWVAFAPVKDDVLYVLCLFTGASTKVYVIVKYATSLSDSTKLQVSVKNRSINESRALGRNCIRMALDAVCHTSTMQTCTRPWYHTIAVIT